MNRIWAYVCGFILLCPAIMHSAAELSQQRSDVDLLVSSLRNNQYEQALEVAQRILPEMGVDTLMRILEGKINFFNESSSKFFDWMQEKRQGERERIEKMRAVQPGKQERELFLLKDLQEGRITPEQFAAQLEELKQEAMRTEAQERKQAVAPSLAPAESYESLRDGIIENYFKGEKFETSRALIEKIKTHYGIPGIERLYNDLEGNALYDLGLRRLRERLLYEIQAGKAVQVPAQVVQPVQKSTVQQTEDPVQASARFAASLKESMEKAGLHPIHVQSIDLCIGGDFAERYFNAESGAFRFGFNQDLKSFHRLKDVNKENARKIMKNLVSEYKIHLMPTDDRFIDAVIALSRAIKDDKDLRQVVHQVKIKPILEPLALSAPAYRALPKIIIYVYGTKDRIQRALNSIYAVFKDWQGVNRTPAFNEKVTSFIYFTQGDRTEKLTYPEYFEEPDRIYFKADVTGRHEDYHLKNPASK
ncbi:MAG TPA: hypothetical protein PKD74_01350 [Candidatus Dependentiae bacterium]|nr:hypothetical protein [Candidatus Dependentiae bacterium]